MRSYQVRNITTKTTYWVIAHSPIDAVTIISMNCNIPEAELQPHTHNGYPLFVSFEDADYGD